MNVTPEEFYDLLAPQYDAMTNFVTRLENETLILQPLVQKYEICRAADMGCGTGLHVFALSRIGVEATGFDISGNMLQSAQQHSSEMKISAQFEQGSFLAPELVTRAPWDAIFCLGNSLPHISSIAELADIFRFWRSCLGKSGVVFIQLLNYPDVFRMKNRIIGIKKSGATTIIRFYDFTEPKLTFNILSITEEGDRMHHTLQSTPLLPLTKDQISAVAEEVGFTRLEYFANMKLNPFSDDSKDLIIVLGNSF
jgi:glycine/sarcosine N-methyltransferase